MKLRFKFIATQVQQSYTYAYNFIVLHVTNRLLKLATVILAANIMEITVLL